MTIVAVLVRLDECCHYGGRGDHILALRADGIVFGLGKNTNGHLGNGMISLRTAPVQVAKLVSVAAMATGEAFSLAVLADATVWAWGLNTNGQVGDGTTTPRLTPVRVGTLSGIVKVAAGRLHALALAGSGAATAWGRPSRPGPLVSNHLPHQQAEIEAGRVDQQALPNVRVSLQVHTAHPTGFVEVGEGPFERWWVKPSPRTP